jgi:hypothetical protein
VGASPPSQLGLSQRWEGIFVSNERISEYTLDRKNQEINNLRRDNGYLADALFRKDYELNELRRQVDDADKMNRFLSITMGIILLAFIAFALYAVRLAAGAQP